jgi:hypothetical protein
MVNNRRRGHGWELETIHQLKALFPKAVSSRQESRTLDAAKVDICYTPPFNFQCKLHTQKVNYPEILASMPEEGINVILHKFATRTKTNFITQGRYAILNYDDFLNLLYERDGLIKKYQENI